MRPLLRAVVPRELGESERAGAEAGGGFDCFSGAVAGAAAAAVFWSGISVSFEVGLNAFFGNANGAGQGDLGEVVVVETRNVLLVSGND